MIRVAATFLTYVCLTLPAVAGENIAGKFEVDFGTRVNRYCAFAASPVNRCASKFVSAYEQAVERGQANFNRTMIITVINSRPRYKQQTVVAIDPRAMKVYPLPFDYFTRSFSKTDPDEYGRLVYSLESNNICVDGEILAYRSTQSGPLCWRFEGNQFVGSETPYTYPER